MLRPRRCWTRRRRCRSRPGATCELPRAGRWRRSNRPAQSAREHSLDQRRRHLARTDKSPAFHVLLLARDAGCSSDSNRGSRCCSSCLPANLASFSKKRGVSSTSGLTMFSGTSPLAAGAFPRPSPARWPCQTSEVDADQCGVRITLSSPISGSSSGSGSTSNTSSPAPAILRSRSAAVKRLLIDQLAPADVDEIGRRLHQGKLCGRDHPASRLASAGNAG